jgi:electron transport complex protein RnfE
MLGLIIGVINTIRLQKEAEKKAIMDAKIAAALAKKSSKTKSIRRTKSSRSKINIKGGRVKWINLKTY